MKAGYDARQRARLEKERDREEREREEQEEKLERETDLGSWSKRLRDEQEVRNQS
jgi:actin-related protein 5